MCKNAMFPSLRRLLLHVHPDTLPPHVPAPTRSRNSDALKVLLQAAEQQQNKQHSAVQVSFVTRDGKTIRARLDRGAMVCVQNLLGQIEGTLEQQPQPEQEQRVVVKQNKKRRVVSGFRNESQQPFSNAQNEEDVIRITLRNFFQQGGVQFNSPPDVFTEMEMEWARDNVNEALVATWRHSLAAARHVELLVTGYSDTAAGFRIYRDLLFPKSINGHFSMKFEIPLDTTASQLTRFLINNVPPAPT